MPDTFAESVDVDQAGKPGLTHCLRKEKARRVATGFL